MGERLGGVGGEPLSEERLGRPSRACVRRAHRQVAGEEKSRVAHQHERDAVPHAARHRGRARERAGASHVLCEAQRIVQIQAVRRALAPAVAAAAPAEVGDERRHRGGGDQSPVPPRHLRRGMGGRGEGRVVRVGVVRAMW